MIESQPRSQLRMGTCPLVVVTVLCTLAFLAAEVTAVKLETDWLTVSMNDVDAVMHESQTGLPAYRILNTIGEDVYIGGNETLVKLSLGTDNEVVATNMTLPTMIPVLDLTCAAKNPTDNETVCWNFIRIAENTSTGDLLVCGTNAFSGLCYTCNADNLSCTVITLDISSLELVPEHYSTNPATLYINTGSGDALYGWNAVKDTFQLYSVNLGNPVSFVLDLDTVTVGLQFINVGATFVGKPFEYTHSNGTKYVFLFYRENALEYTSGTKEYSRIARLCQDDPGGNSNTKKFITFTKARLQCSIPDDILPYYYDDIQDVVWDPSNNEAYAIFTSQANGPATSALCRYRMEDIMKLFDEGEFKNQEKNDVNKQWLPVTPTPSPRPGTCGVPGTTAYPPLLDKMVPNYNPAEDTGGLQASPPGSLPNSDPPTLYVDGVRFTSLAVDFDYDCVYFFGTTTGTVIKSYKDNGSCGNIGVPFKSVEVNVLGTSTLGPITGLALLGPTSSRRLVITTDTSIIRWPLNTKCPTTYELPQECMIKFPYCEETTGTYKCTCSATDCNDGAPTGVSSVLQVWPGDVLTSCYNEYVYWFCHLNSDNKFVPENSFLEWNADIDGTLVKETNYTDHFKGLRVLVRKSTEGTYNCTANIDGTLLTKQVEVNNTDCLTDQKLQDRCDEYNRLQEQYEALKSQDIGVNGKTCAVAIENCDTCPP